MQNTRKKEKYICGKIASRAYVTEALVRQIPGLSVS